MRRPRALLALALAGLLAACSPLVPAGQLLCLPRDESRFFLEDLVAGDKASEQKGRTPEPRREAFHFGTGGRAYDADLYLPGGTEKPRAGLVMAPGASQAGRDDERMVAFGKSLARAGFAVLVPEIPSLRDLQVSAADTRYVRDAFSYLATREDLAPQGRAGLAGISYAIGPALIAADDPLIRSRVRFVVGIGGYHDLGKVLTFFTTGSFRGRDGAWQHLEPNPYGKWAFVLSNARRFYAGPDQPRLEAIAGKKLQKPDADVKAEVASLQTAEGKALMALMDNQDPERAPALAAALPAAARAELEALDLSRRDLSGLKAPVLLVHGYDDSLIPYTEGEALARALPNSRLVLVHGLNHVEFQAPGPYDLWSLGCAGNAFLDFRH